MPWFTSFSIQAGLHSFFFLLVQCFRFWLFVQSSAQSSDKYFSFFARGGCYWSKQILGLEESCPERSWLASRCQSMARRGNKKPNKPANTKTPPNRRNHHHQRTRHVMFTKHRLWEIPAGKTMKYTHTISKHTIRLLQQSLFHIWIPKLCTFTLHSIWHQPFAPKASVAPRMQHRLHESSCYMGQTGNSVSISPGLWSINISGHTWILILLKQGWWTCFYGCFCCRRAGGRDPLDFPLTDIGDFFYHRTGIRYHPT